MIGAYLYDAAGHDQEIEVSLCAVADLGPRQLLWIDVTGREGADLEKVGRLLNLKPDSIQDLKQVSRTFALASFGEYVQFDVAALHHDRSVAAPLKVAHSARLDLLVGPSWLLTVHEPPLPFLDAFRRQDRGETQIGALNAAALAASLLDWHLGEYLAALENVEILADRLDVRLLSERQVRNDLLSDLVSARRHVSSLRRSLSPQNAIFYGLSRPVT